MSEKNSKVSVVEEDYSVEDIERDFQRDQVYLKLRRDEAAYDSLRMHQVRQNFEDLEF